MLHNNPAQNLAAQNNHFIMFTNSVGQNFKCTWGFGFIQKQWGQQIRRQPLLKKYFVTHSSPEKEPGHAVQDHIAESPASVRRQKEQEKAWA